MEKKLITFLDSAQRTIIAEEKEVTDTMVKVSNPVVVNIVPQTFPAGHPQQGQQTGQMALQLLPVYFREFQADKSQGVLFTYHLDSITSIEIEGGFDFRLDAQYEQIFNPPQQAEAPVSNVPPPIPGAAQAPQPQQAAAPTLNLFDDEGSNNNG
jgi:hypothetical protein